MYTSAQIRWHISRMGDGELFATRDLLSYGPRQAIDKAIQRMIKRKMIIRLARGVFMKALYIKGKLSLPPLIDIVRTKAVAFGKRIYTHGRDAANAFNIVLSGNSAPTFAASGYSSKFRCQSAEFEAVTVHFKGTSPRDQKLRDTIAGQVIRALRYLGAKSVDQSVWLKTMRGLSKQQHRELKASLKWMPEWMASYWWQNRCKAEVIDPAVDPFDGLRQKLGNDFASLGIRPFVPYWIG